MLRFGSAVTVIIRQSANPHNDGGNAVTNTIIPLPAGAVTVGEWRRNSYEEWRPFDGTHRQVDACGGPVEIQISGEQYSAGRIERYVIVGDFCLDAEHLGQWAEATHRFATRFWRQGTRSRPCRTLRAHCNRERRRGDGCRRHHRSPSDRVRVAGTTTAHRVCV
jgi:hypothetical protein